MRRTGPSGVTPLVLSGVSGNGKQKKASEFSPLVQTPELVPCKSRIELNYKKTRGFLVRRYFRKSPDSVH